MDRLFRKMMAATACDGCGVAFTNGCTVARAGRFYCRACELRLSPEWQAERDAAKAAWQASRKPCEMPECKRPATKRLAGVLVCGRHCTAIQKAHAATRQTYGNGFDIIAALTRRPPTREEMIALVNG